MRWSILVALPLALLGVGELIDHMYWNAAYKMYSRPVSQSVAIVSIGARQGSTTADQARVLEQVRRLMPRRVFLDARIEAGRDPVGDAALSNALRSYGNDIAIVARGEKVDHFEPSNFRLPPQSIAADVPVVLTAWQSNFLFYAKSAPATIRLGNRVYPTLSTALAHRSIGEREDYYPDFALDPASIVEIPAARLDASGPVSGMLSGRTVILSDVYQNPPVLYFGHNLVEPVALDIAGAAGIDKPMRFSFGRYVDWIPPWLLAIALIAFARTQRGWKRAVPQVLVVVGAIVLPFTLRQFGIIVSTEALWPFLAAYGSIRLWQKRTRRIQHTSVSGLPNLLALSNSTLPVGRDVVVAVIARYDEMLATLPQDLHGECAHQIARRISVGSGAEEIFHGNSGHFAWTEEARPLEMQLSHLEGLRALFSAPLQVGTHTFDTNIHFGLDRNEGLDALTRVNSALASANEALGNGRAIELFEAQRLAEAPWELSLHARIDEGLRNGDIWLAFQPQWDLAANSIYGAEALIRWNHPTRGPITPDAFIIQAERAGRIDALTYWVLEEAIGAALELNALGPRFQMSVNLSAQMVDKADLVERFMETVRRRGIDPGLLTVEITETSSVRNRPAACQNLTRLRQLGFRLSIDDFGTGEASLAYLSDLPSDELKLDRRFVARVLESDRDRAIVSSTIQLAHSLNQVVVAEGIEDAATCNLLRDLGCDCAQGYYLGRPQAFPVFRAQYLDQRLSHSRSV